MTAKQLVGTDLVQAIPLVAAATISHMLFGHVDFALTGSLLIGSLPGVYVGAKVSSRAPDSVIRPALIVILFASALKLLDVSNSALGVTLLLVVLTGAPLWGATDASLRPLGEWEASGFRRTTWVTAQAVAAPFLVGFPIAVCYAFVRPPATRATADCGSRALIDVRPRSWGGRSGLRPHGRYTGGSASRWRRR
jgi:hypothetical protein